MRWLKRLATLIVALFVVVPVAVYLLIATTTGSRFVLAQAIKFAPVAVSYDELTGTLIDTITLKNLTLTTATQRYAADAILMSWRPLDLFEQKITINELRLNNPSIYLLGETNEANAAIELPEVKLPFELAIARLSIDNFALQTTSESNDSSTSYRMNLITSLKLSDSRLTLNELSIKAEQPEFVFQHNGRISADLRANYRFAITGRYSLNFTDTRITPVNGDLQIDGALQGSPIDIRSTFTSHDSLPQQLTAQISSPLAELDWHAELKLNRLPLSLAKPWLSDFDEHVERFITVDSTLSGKAIVNASSIELIDVQANKIGSTNGTVTLNGSWQHNNFSVDYQQSSFELTSHYRDLAYRSDAFNITALNGTSTVSGTPLDYSFDNTINLTIDAAPEVVVDELVADISGTGSLSGITVSALELTSDELSLTSQLQASWEQALALRLQIESARSNIGLTDAEALLKGDLELANNELKFSNFMITVGQTELTLNGSTIDNNLTGELVVNNVQQLPYLPEGLSELRALETAFAIDTSAELSQFEFTINRFIIQTESLDRWLLTQQTSLNVSQNKQIWEAELNQLCLQHETNQFGLLCADLILNQKSLIVNLTGERLSLWLLNRFRERDVAQRVAGLVQLTASATMNRETFQVRDMAVQLTSDNTVFFALNQETSTRLSYWELNARGNADALTAEIEGQLANNEGGLFGDLAVLDLYGKREVQGDLLFSLDDLAMLDWVLPGMRYHGGKATAQLSLSGTLNEPNLSGDMEVYAESVVFAETNFVFNDVRLALIDRPDSRGEIEIEGQAKAGEDGWLLVEGVAMPLDAEAYLRITGKNFRALQMPTATVDISPDLTVYVNDRAIDIAGTVDVPFAKITAPDFETSVSNSNDVQITRGGQPVTEGFSKGDNLAVNAQIRVNLGQQVSVDAYGFTGRLQGSLEVVEQPRRPTTAIGSINVANGSYELYGQELAIDRGSFIYNGGDISNPGLDLRVKRDISNGNSLRNVNVGAQVVGTLTEPDFQLFSTPAMPDSEILSYLILGKSMQSASATSSNDIQLQALLMLGAKGTEAIGESLQDTFGIDEFGIDNDPNTRETSFYIGKYLSPKLFVRYGVGLLESTNTFMVRYQLTERLLIETMASSQAQGGDIFYTFER
ncbi:translocation/assembly module TamB domain-containing protein [Pseudidiomarina homiensis]|uniref:translocation/assembly module TamB domain-containing protein n=1 Tax=Pseudidiomarina homiensis TaxID=364198 RepID=UPI00215B3BD8|nr:translocation/assembly module TamB domain-containing protein [Pseudidiomarina homiensis]